MGARPSVGDKHLVGRQQDIHGNPQVNGNIWTLEVANPTAEPQGGIGDPLDERPKVSWASWEPQRSATGEWQ